MRTGRIRLAVISTLLLLVSGVSLHSAQDRRGQADRYLKRYRIIEMDTRAIAARVRATGRLSLPTEDGEFNISLEPIDMRAPGYRAEEVGANGVTRPVFPEALRTYRGTVPGIQGSEARFSIREDLFEGIVITPLGWYLVEPMNHYDPQAAPDAMVVYRASDIESTEFGTCATALPDRILEQVFKVQQMVSAPAMVEATSLSVADVATEADYEFVTAQGGSANANNTILDIMNQVDGIYRAQLSMSLRVIYQHTWDTQNDPYTSTAAASMLTEFKNYWISNYSSVPFDLVHMWTGRDMDGSTVGIAYLAVACNARSYSFGLSQSINAAPAKYLLTAHEIGHNFGANHTESANPPQPDCSNTIMNSSIGSGTTFCPYSKTEISSHVTQYPSCLASISGGCDINNDGQLNVLDMQSLANAILGVSACPGVCDSNKDGSVNVLDVQLQANIVLGTATCP